MRRASAMRRLALACTASLLGACGSAPHIPASPIPLPNWPIFKHQKVDPGKSQLPNAGSGRGGYYQDDGPGDNPPANLRDLPDAVVRAEPYSRYGNRPYAVFGKTYVPLTGDEPFVQRGLASWYGKKFHGQRTSSGELYDMYQMTAAHPTLPIPSFARVTSLDTGNQVVVRINDRGPFHSSRIIDVSYTAALKLGMLGKGSGQVEVERLLPDDPAKLATRRRNAPLLPDVVPAVAPVMADPLMEAVTMPVASSSPPSVTVNLSRNTRSNVRSTSPSSTSYPSASTNPSSTAPASSSTSASPSGAAPIGPASIGPASINDADARNNAPAAGSEVETAAGLYVQLGAFSQGEKAVAMRDRIEQNVGAGVAGLGLGAPIVVVQGGALHRLFCGPFASRAEAQQALKSVPGVLGLKPMIVRRD
jgi:rare lipoprotein A